MKSILTVAVMSLALTSVVLCRPFYFYSSTRDFKLTLVYDIEAVANEPYTVTIDYTSLVNMTIHEMKLSIWSIKDLSYTLLREVILVENANISDGWSIRRSVTITVPNNATELLIELFINYSIEVQRMHNCEVTVAIREQSYDELVKSIKDLGLEVNDLSSKLDQLEIELERIKANYSKLVSNYSELKRAYEYLKEEYDLSKDYENKTIELERIRERYERLVEDHSELSKEYNDLKAKYNETYVAYLNFKSKYEELSRIYEELIKRNNSLVQRYVLLSNVTTALGMTLILILIYINRERLVALLERIKEYRKTA